MAASRLSSLPKYPVPGEIYTFYKIKDRKIIEVPVAAKRHDRYYDEHDRMIRGSLSRTPHILEQQLKADRKRQRKARAAIKVDPRLEVRQILVLRHRVGYNCEALGHRDTAAAMRLSSPWTRKETMAGIKRINKHREANGQKNISIDKMRLNEGLRSQYLGDAALEQAKARAMNSPGLSQTESMTTAVSA